MNDIKLTHYYGLADVPDHIRAMIFNEFAENGSPNLVLADDVFTNTFRPQYSKQLKEDAAAAGVTFVDAHAPFGNGIDLSTYDPSRRRLIINWAKLVLNTAADFNVDTVTFHLSSPPIDECPLAVRHDIVVSALEKILPEAEACGVVICLENVWSPINSAGELLKLMDIFKSPWLGVCYDAGHANIMSESHGKAVAAPNPLRNWGVIGREPEWDDNILEKLLPHIVTCHLHDNDGYKDLHQLPGDGNIDWERTMKLLAKAPRLRYVQNEAVPRRFQPACSIGHICRTFDKLMDMMK